MIGIPRNVLKILLVFFIPIAVFATNLDGTWILDDHYQVEDNPYIRSVHHVPRLLTTRVWQSTSKETEGSQIYRPVFMLSYLIDYHVFGLRPFWFHLINNLIHGLNCVLLFLLARRFLPFGFALGAALFFGLHPINVEAVTWIGGRMDLLGTLFGLATIHLMLRLLDAKAKRRIIPWILFGCAVPLGLFSKETVFFVPFLVLAGLLISDPERSRRVATYLSLTAVAGIQTAVCFWVRVRIVGTSAFSLLNLDTLRNFNGVVKRFLFLLFVPSDTDFFNVYAYTPFRWKVDLPPFLFIAAILALAAWWRRRDRAFLIGLALFLGALIPVVMVVHLHGLLSERYFYLPLAGFSLALGALLAALARNVEGFKRAGYRGVALLLSGLYLTSLAATTVMRNREWHDEVRLYAASMRRTPASDVPYFFMAWHYFRTGERDAEVQYYVETLRRNPDSIVVLNNLGVRMTERGRFDAAKKLFDRALHVEPGRAKTSYNMGYLFESQGNLPKATEWYRRALELDPNYELAQKALFRLRGP
ncbi:MAG: tetratricopeptide repeat protein [Pseudomonadota bacterium]